MRDLGNHPLATLLTARIKYLDRQRSELEKQLAEIDSEREFTASTLTEWYRVKAEANQGPQPKKTIKQAIVEVLALYPEGLTKSEIIAKALQDAGLAIEAPSIGSQLQRLEADGDITRSGKTWALVRA